MKRMWAIVFIVAGGAVLIYGIGIIRDARACANWPRADGCVITAEVEVVSREQDMRTYAPSVTYTFSVGGREFKGTRLTIVPRNTIGEHTVKAMLAPYPVSSAVAVFHDPKDPSNCVLSTATNGSEWAFAIGGVLLLGVGLLFVPRG